MQQIGPKPASSARVAEYFKVTLCDFNPSPAVYMKNEKMSQSTSTQPSPNNRNSSEKCPLGGWIWLLKKCKNVYTFETLVNTESVFHKYCTHYE